MGSLGRLLELCRLSWVTLGALWAVLGCSWTLSGLSWATLGAPVGGLQELAGPLWAVLGRFGGDLGRKVTLARAGVGSRRAVLAEKWPWLEREGLSGEGTGSACGWDRKRVRLVPEPPYALLTIDVYV